MAGTCLYEDIVEEALCFARVDGLPRGLDERRSILLLSLRKPGSAWSKANKVRAERLIEQGRMTATGRAAIEQAKADGSWSFLNDVEALVLPDDLAEALRTWVGAAENFNALPRSAKRSILEWIKRAKRAKTRTKRVEETARVAAAILEPIGTVARSVFR